MTAVALPSVAARRLAPAIPLGTSQGGVWFDETLGCWAYTCERGCGFWAKDYWDKGDAAIGLWVHEREDCPCRPQRRAADSAYVREDPEDVPVDVPDWVELVGLGAGPGRVAVPPPVQGVAA